MAVDRRSFLRGAAAAVAGAALGPVIGSQLVEVPITIEAELTVVPPLLPVKDLVDYVGWAAKVYRVRPAPAGEMLGPEWWMTDEELASVAIDEDEYAQLTQAEVVFDG